MIIGTRSVMVVGFVAGIGATVIGVLVGVTAGYIGGIGDEGLSVLSNVFLVIPQLPLIIIIAGQLPSVGGVTVALVIAVTGWAWGARVLRAQTLSLATAGLRRGRARQRREHLAHHHRGDPAQPHGDHRLGLRRHGGFAVLTADHAGVHRHRRPRRVELGHGAVLARSPTWRCSAAPGGGSCRPACASPWSAWRSRSSTSASTSSSTRACAASASTPAACASAASAPASASRPSCTRSGQGATTELVTQSEQIAVQRSPRSTRRTA